MTVLRLIAAGTIAAEQACKGALWAIPNTQLAESNKFYSLACRSASHTCLTLFVAPHADLARRHAPGLAIARHPARHTRNSDTETHRHRPDRLARQMGSHNTLAKISRIPAWPPLRRRREPGNSPSSSSTPRRCAPSGWPAPRRPACAACAPASWRATDRSSCRAGPPSGPPPWRP